MNDTFSVDRVTWVFDQTALGRLHAVLDAVDEVCFDCETTGLNEYHREAKITMVQMTFLPRDKDWRRDEPDTWLVPLYHLESPWLGSWRRVYREIAEILATKYLMAQNGKFDCRWTYAMTGVDLAPALMWDSRISAHLLDENVSTRLKDRAPRIFGIPDWSEDIDMTGPGASLAIPLFTLGWYGARDTYWTWKSCMKDRAEMFTLDQDEDPVGQDEAERARLGRLAQWVAMPTTRTMTRVENRGFPLDVGWVKEHLDADLAIRDENFRELIHRYPGLDPDDASLAPTSGWFKSWIQKATEAGDLSTVATTKNGNPQWNKAVLVRLERQGSEVAKRLLEYRAAVKRIEYLKSWLAFLRHDGCIHANYNVGSLITGRLSSDSPNMQQITKALRPAFVPRSGHVTVDLDFSQIELRVAAYVARCQPMIEAFQQGRDLHIQIAGRVQSDAAIRAASLYLMSLGLPADRTGTEALSQLHRLGRAGETTGEGVRQGGQDRADQESGSGFRRSTRGAEEPLLEGWIFPSALSALPESLVREVRGYRERQRVDVGRSSHRPQSWEPGSLELDDALQIVSSTSAPRLQELTSDPWSAWRQMGKASNFGLLYGQTPYGFKFYAENQYDISFSDDACQRIYDAFFDEWDGMAQWHAGTINRLHREHQVVSPLGRVRRFPGYISEHAENAAINAPVQGMASDLLQIAAASIEGTLPGSVAVRDAYLVGTVHDSLVAEVPEDRWEPVVVECIDRMTTGVLPVLRKMGVDFDVPITVEASIGSRWGLSDVGKVG